MTPQCQYRTPNISIISKFLVTRLCSLVWKLIGGAENKQQEILIHCMFSLKPHVHNSAISMFDGVTYTFVCKCCFCITLNEMKKLSCQPIT
jgi:hypothetical protein